MAAAPVKAPESLAESQMRQLDNQDFNSTSYNKRKSSIALAENFGSSVTEIGCGQNTYACCRQRGRRSSHVLAEAW
jgi:hypothetical protein